MTEAAAILAFDIGSVNLSTCQIELAADGKIGVSQWAVEPAAVGATVGERVRKLVQWFHKKEWCDVAHFVIEQQSTSSPTNYALHMVLFALLIRRYPRAEVSFQQAHLKYSSFGVQLRGLAWRQRKNLSVTLARSVLDSTIVKSADEGARCRVLLDDQKKKDDFADSFLICCVHACTLGRLNKAALMALFVTTTETPVSVTVIGPKQSRYKRHRAWQLANSVCDDSVDVSPL